MLIDKFDATTARPGIFNLDQSMPLKPHVQIRLEDLKLVEWIDYYVARAARFQRCVAWPGIS